METADERGEIIRNHVGAAMAAAVTPLPIVDIAAVTAVQIALVRKLARSHGVAWDGMRGRAVVIAVVGASLSRVGASAAKSLPGVGWLVGGAAQAALSGASTWALGAAFHEHFRRSGSLADAEPESLRERYRAGLVRGRDVVRAMRRTMRDEAEPGDEVARLARLEGLRRSGAITQDEFERLLAPRDEEAVSR